MAFSIWAASAIGALSSAALAAESATGPTGLYFDSKSIAQMHARGGGALFNMPMKNYRVIAGHHNAPNMAEIHRHAADIVYFIEGSAVVVTGGTVVNPKFPSEGEVVGTALEGGEAHKVGPGDVIVMMAGTPHWFKEVTGDIRYLTIHLDHME